MIGKNFLNQDIGLTDIQEYLASVDDGRETALEQPVSIPAESNKFAMHYASASIRGTIDIDLSHANSYDEFSGKDVVIIAKRCLDFSMDFESRIQNEAGFFESVEAQMELARERCEMIAAQQVLSGQIANEEGQARVYMPGPLWPGYVAISDSSLHNGRKIISQNMQDIDRIWGDLPIVSFLQIVEQDHHPEDEAKLHISLSSYPHYVELPLNPMILMHMAQKLDALENPSK